METMAPLQIETVNGQVAHTINNNNHQHSHAHHHQHQHQHDHHHTHIEAPAFALQAPPAPPAPPAHFRQRGQPAADITAAQKALLALMRPLPKPARLQVLDFMRVEFGTGLVVQLDPNELQQVRRMVLDARRVAGV